MEEIITVNTPDNKTLKFIVIEKVNRDASTEYLKGRKFFTHPNSPNLAFIVREIEDAVFEDIPNPPQELPKTDEIIEPKIEEEHNYV